MGLPKKLEKKMDFSKDIEINPWLLVEVSEQDSPVTALLDTKERGHIRLPYHEDGTFCRSLGMDPSTACPGTDECSDGQITSMDLVDVDSFH